MSRFFGIGKRFFGIGKMTIIDLIEPKDDEYFNKR